LKKSIQNRNPNGFTLVEVMLTVAFLGLLGAAASTVYFSGQQSLDYQADRMLLDGLLRSRMEVLIGTDFDLLSSGSEDVTINGTTYTINWTVVAVDLNADSITESSAKSITVSVSGMLARSLTTIIADHENLMGKIS